MYQINIVHDKYSVGRLVALSSKFEQDMMLNEERKEKFSGDCGARGDSESI